MHSDTKQSCLRECSSTTLPVTIRDQDHQAEICRSYGPMRSPITVKCRMVYSSESLHTAYLVSCHSENLLYVSLN